MRAKIFLCAMAMAFVGLVAHRIWQQSTVSVPAMPVQLAETEERELHFVAGGKYTPGDVESNGHIVPSQKYRGFRARHQAAQPGDAICPVTRTKANPSCTWTVGGQVYQFCCPPCIDEFVQLAKHTPEAIHPPEAYVR